ncbi:unnamed protein product [Caenorhabditis brenneri]
MKIKIVHPEKNEMQTELTLEEKEKVYTVLSALLTCIGSAIIFSTSFFEKGSQTILGFIVLAVGYWIFMLSMFSHRWLIIEEDRFSLFQKWFRHFPDRVQKILLSHTRCWPFVHFPYCMGILVYALNQTSLFLKVLTPLCLFLAIFVFVKGYRDTRETTKDVQ